MNAPDNHGGWNKVSGKLNRFIDFDNALTHHRDFVFGVLGVTEARSSYVRGGPSEDIQKCTEPLAQ